MLRQIDDVLDDAARRAGKRWGCGPGRTDCCIGPFPINLLDARRLARGLSELEARDPSRAAAIVDRARHAASCLLPDFPGDPASGVLDDDEPRQEAWCEVHAELPCPVLDPAAGTCELYEHRPWTCRTFGPPLRVGDEKLPQCPYCFAQCTDEEADELRVEPDPDGVEDAILDALEREEGVAGETVVALALLGSPRTAGDAERVLLLVPTTTYKVDDFLAAGRALGVEVVIGSDRKQALEDESPGTTLTIDFRRPAWSVERIAAFHASWPLRAVVGADDETTALAADAARALGFAHNPPGAVRTARDKHAARSCYAAAGLRTPWHDKFALADDPAVHAARARYPCVQKPLGLSASRGVIRADDPAEFVAAFERIRGILESDDLPADADREHLLVEGYLPGREVAVEGLLERGAFRVLAIFDKPDPLEGPTFEETLYVTPARLTAAETDALIDETARGCRALGLSEGPVHAELRIHEGQPWLLEIAPRTIGGLCSRVLRFGTGISLESLVLRHALGRSVSGLERESAAAGVMMLPVPARGVLREVHGLYDARRVEGVREITLTMTRGSEVVPLPEGHRYLGFVFATGPTASRVEATLREAHSRLRFEIG